MKKNLLTLFVSFLFLLNFSHLSVANASYQEKYNYEIYQQSDDATVNAGSSVILWTKLRNVGSYDWNSDGNFPLHLGTASPRDRSSGFMSADKWLSPNRISLTERNNDIYTFAFTADIPYSQAAGTYRECFYPVLENLTWVEKTPICWNIHVQNDNYQYIATPLENNFSFDMKSGEEKQVEFAVRNDGSTTWYKYGSYPIHLGTTYPSDRASDFYSSSWLSYNRPASLNEDTVVPGATGHFTFTIQAPSNPQYADYYEYFAPVAEFRTWFYNYGYGSNVLNFYVHITDFDNNDDDNNGTFSQKYSDISVDKDFIENDDDDTAEIKVTLRDKNDDPIKNVWFDLISKEIDPDDPDDWEINTYTIKTDSSGKATYDFSTYHDADFEFTFKYDGTEYNTPVKFSAYDPDDESKDFSDQYSSITINKDYIEDDGDDEAKIDVEIRDHDDDPIKNKSFKLVVREREYDEDNWDEYTYSLSTNSSGRATKYFTTDNKSDFEFSFELNGDRFRHWEDLRSYEDDEDNDYDPDNSSIRINRTSIKGNGSDYGLIEVNVRDQADEPMEYQKIILTGERCNLSGYSCHDLDEIKLTTDNSGYAEYKIKYDGEAEFEMTYEVDGEDSDQYINFEFYDDGSDSDEDFDLTATSKSNGIKLSWDEFDDDEVDSYKILKTASDSTPTYPDNSYKSISDAGTTNYTDISVDDGEDYYYRIAVYYDGEVTDYSNIVHITYDEDADSEDIDLSGSSTNSGIKLSWDKYTDEDIDGYKILKSTSDSSLTYPDNSYKYVSGYTTNEYTDVSVDDGEDYYYRVGAYDNGDIVAYSNTIHITYDEDDDSEDGDFGLTATSNSSGIKLSWDEFDDDEVDSYKILKSTSDSTPTYPSQSYKSISDAGTTTYTDTSVDDGEDYYYRIAVYYDGEVTDYSDVVHITYNED